MTKHNKITLITKTEKMSRYRIDYVKIKYPDIVYTVYVYGHCSECVMWPFKRLHPEDEFRAFRGATLDPKPTKK